jgi:hypothetical protein
VDYKGLSGKHAPTGLWLNFWDDSRQEVFVNNNIGESCYLIGSLVPFLG